MAYLDGEMTAAEALELERSLSPADLARLEAEKRMESALCEALCEGPDVPAALWQRNKITMRNGRPRHVQRRWLVFAGGTGMVAAALFAVFVFLHVTPRGDGFWSVGAPSTIELAKLSAVPDTKTNIENYLNAHGISVAIPDFPYSPANSPHKVDLLGVTSATYQGSEVVELLYSCCGFPAKVVIVNDNTAAADDLRRAKMDGRVQRLRHMGGYLAGLITSHETNAVLDELKLTTNTLDLQKG